jgi:hypothetical protein
MPPEGAKSSLGTWLITNFQAALTEFRVIDEEIEHRGGKV